MKTEKKTKSVQLIKSRVVLWMMNAAHKGVPMNTGGCSSQTVGHRANPFNHRAAGWAITLLLLRLRLVIVKYNLGAGGFGP